MIGSMWYEQGNRISVEHYGVARRSFFVPDTTCQALTLRCLAPSTKALEAQGSRLEAFAWNLEPRAQSHLRGRGS